MKRICAWCRKDLRLSPARDEADAPITHGICGDCVRRLFSSKARPLKDFLERYEKPVFLVTPQGPIVTGNAVGLSLLINKPETKEGELGGDAFGCRYADLPGGCGKTAHCKTCTIRLTVADTLKTGKSHFRVPAYPDLHHVTGEDRIRFLITTERVGDAVLLRIDDVRQEQPLSPGSPEARN
ncbi:MAG TPA: hypothetical protein VLS90_01050 [Thermodesulfobacteriota bacterium]|nr:hypothetical protein [Thermodesulfobacteriota bacterium]